MLAHFRRFGMRDKKPRGFFRHGAMTGQTDGHGGGMATTWQRELTQAAQWRPTERLRLSEELSRWRTLQAAARAQPAAWHKAVAARQAEVGLWLYRMALAVAAAGCPGLAVSLLDSLPGVTVDGAVRLALAEALETERALSADAA